MERTLGRADLRFLERAFQGLMLNFSWWVNRKDPAGRNVFAGGFLGLDNIGVFDRSAQLPTGGSLEQADGTAWMAFYCQNMLEIALILTEYDPMYEEVAYKFVEHFVWISYAMDRIGEHQDEMWRSEEHTSELQSPCNLVCRLLLEKKKPTITPSTRASRSLKHRT